MSEQHLTWVGLEHTGYGILSDCYATAAQPRNPEKCNKKNQYSLVVKYKLTISASIIISNRFSPSSLNLHKLYLFYALSSRSFLS